MSPDSIAPEVHERNSAVPFLTDNQRLNFETTLRFISEQLEQIEFILHSSAKQLPFQKYAPDLSPAQARIVADLIGRFRSQLFSALRWQHIESSAAAIPVSSAILTRLNLIDRSLFDVRPNALNKSAALSEQAAFELTGILRELALSANAVTAYLQARSSGDLQERIGRLISKNDFGPVLSQIQEAINTHHLIEFRQRLEILLSRIENTTFEVAVFGRVSTGKSSFLNTFLDSDLLPVGAHPVTAVPTRIAFGTTVQPSVRSGEEGSKIVSLDRFRELISEAGNPNNVEIITRATLLVPAARLSDGVVLVDTPGLGSLALRGAQETLAYLPSCDFALLLVDAGSTLSAEDIRTLQLLDDAGIPFTVLLSKADVLPREQISSSCAYIRTKVREELREDINVYPISSVTGFKQLITAFYEQELRKRFDEAQALAAKSIGEKLRRLHSDVRSVIASRERALGLAERISPERLTSLEAKLLTAAATLASMERRVENRLLSVSSSISILETMAKDHADELRVGKILSAAELRDHMQALLAQRVREIVNDIGNSASRAISEVCSVGTELERKGMPDADEILSLIRDTPIPDLTAPTGTFEAGVFSHLGPGMRRIRLLRSMKKQFEPRLSRELLAYSSTLGEWSRHRLSLLRSAIESFAESFRAELQALRLPAIDKLKNTAGALNETTESHF